MRNEVIISLCDALGEVLGEASKDLSIKTKFKLAKNRKILEPLYNVIMEQRDNIVKKYGVEDKNGSVTVPTDKIGIVNKEMQELSKIENECELEKITLEELGDAPIQGNVLMNLFPIIEEALDN